jgi:hypothetical protein
MSWQTCGATANPVGRSRWEHTSYVVMSASGNSSSSLTQSKLSIKAVFSVLSIQSLWSKLVCKTSEGIDDSLTTPGGILGWPFEVRRHLDTSFSRWPIWISADGISGWPFEVRRHLDTLFSRWLSWIHWNICEGIGILIELTGFQGDLSRFVVTSIPSFPDGLSGSTATNIGLSIRLTVS